MTNGSTEMRSDIATTTQRSLWLRILGIFTRKAEGRAVGGSPPSSASKALALCILVAAASGVCAQTASTPPGSVTLEEVVVTAEKRSENIQQVPIAVTAISAEALQERHIFDSSQIPEIAPSLQQQSINNQVGATNFSIRGIGTSVFGPAIESSVGTVIDDVALARPQMAIVQFFDLDRIEVLEGPQGMLFGKNASAGLINIVTAEPALGKYDALAHVSYGKTDDGTAGNQVVAQGAVNLPVTGNSALRLSSFGTYQNGFVKNILRPSENLGMQEYGAKVKYRWKPSDAWDVYFIADYAYEMGPGNSVLTKRSVSPGGFMAQQDALAGITASPKNFEVASDATTTNRFSVGGTQLKVSYQFGGGFSLTNILAYRRYNDHDTLDSDHLPIDYWNIDVQGRRQSQVSDELRLSSPSGQKLEYQFGLYYLDLDAWNGGTVNLNLVPLFPAPPAGFANAGATLDDLSQTKSYAAYVQAKYSITPDLRLTVGGRFTDDRMNYVAVNSAPNVFIPLLNLGTFQNETSERNFSYRSSVQYDLARDVMAYFSWARGYKGATFDQNSARFVAPEIPVAIELGFKSTLFNRRLVLNASLFRENFHGFQAQALGPVGVGFVTLNAGNLESKGVEAQFRALPLKGLTLSGGVMWNQAIYSNFPGVPCYPGQPAGTSGTGVCLPNGTTDASGNTLVDAPTWTGTIAANYQHAIHSGLSGFVAADCYVHSAVNYSASADPNTRVGGFGILGASFGVQADDSKWRVSVFVKNLLNKVEPTVILQDGTSGLNGDATGDYWQQFGQESFRTIGASFDYRM
jgi:iron complex outermembrane receptor protein